MDYILQMEKLYKFLEFTLDLNEIREMYKVKHGFNDDLNLFGSFIKDFLTIQNDGVVSDDDNLYDDFVLWFERTSYNTKKAVKEISDYSKYYIMIVFEEIEDIKILTAVSTINACFAIDCYPNLMKAFYGFYSGKIEKTAFYSILEMLTDIVLKRYEDLSGSVLSYQELEDRLNHVQRERAVV